MASSSESLTVRIDSPVKQALHELARISERSMSYHTQQALMEYVAREKMRLENLSREIEAGIRSLDAGKGIRMSAGLFEDIKQHGRQRLKELDDQT